MTLELQLAAEGLESLSSALVNDHEEAKANARKLHAYCQHVSTVLGAPASSTAAAPLHALRRPSSIGTDSVCLCVCVCVCVCVVDLSGLR